MLAPASWFPSFLAMTASCFLRRRARSRKLLVVVNLVSISGSEAELLPALA